MDQKEQQLALMERFRMAYARQDRDELLATTTSDFIWQQHDADTVDDLPAGRVLQGVDALLTALKWRGEHWQQVRYADLEERTTGDMLVQTFTISGQEDGKPFHAKAVDLYRLKDGLISSKETFWKQLK